VVRAQAKYTLYVRDRVSATQRNIVRIWAIEQDRQADAAARGGASGSAGRGRGRERGRGRGSANARKLVQQEWTVSAGRWKGVVRQVLEARSELVRDDDERLIAPDVFTGP